MKAGQLELFRQHGVVKCVVILSLNMLITVQVRSWWIGGNVSLYTLLLEKDLPFQLNNLPCRTRANSNWRRPHLFSLLF